MVRISIKPNKPGFYLIFDVTKVYQPDRLLVLVTSDHGDFLGAHGIYCKNIGAFEEAYNIPFILSGPGIGQGTSKARVTLQDFYPTLMEYLGCDYEKRRDSRSILSLLKDPQIDIAGYDDGFAEYFGGRMLLNQRVYYKGSWKYIFNGFDKDELYNLEVDPGELTNLAADPLYGDKLKSMTAGCWAWIKETGDHTLYNSHYPPFRFAATGPDTD